MQLSRRMDRFGDEIFAALNKRKLEMEQEGRVIYNLSVGTPDFETAPHIREALIDAAKDPENWKYALRDTPELLEAVCAYYKKRFDVEIEPDMVCSCYGSEEGMGHIGLVLCDEGDTVILPTPCYPVFIAGAQMAGAVPYYYPMTEETGFLPRVSDIPEEIAEKAKYMIVSLPSNPTGSIAEPGIYEELIHFAKKYDILLLHDNAYSDIIFDGAVGGSLFQHEGAEEVGIEFFSLSKSFNVTGFVRYAFQFVNYILLGGSKTGKRVLFLIYVCCEQSCFLQEFGIRSVYFSVTVAVCRKPCCVARLLLCEHAVYNCREDYRILSVINTVAVHIAEKHKLKRFACRVKIAEFRLCAGCYIIAVRSQFI